MKVQLDFLVILHIGIFTKITRSIYLPPINKDIAVTGPIKVGITLRDFAFTHQRIDPKCDSGSSESAKCDPLAVLRVCPLQNLPVPANDELTGLKRVMCDRILNHIPVKDTCAVLVYREDNVNYKSLIRWLHVSTSISPLFSNLFRFSGVLADRDGNECEIFVHEHETHIREKLQNLYVLKFTSWRPGYMSFIKFEFLFRCDRFYHGIRCWYYCRSIPKKQFCVDSLPYCLGFWSFHLVRYKLLFLKNEIKEKHECLFYNKCKDPSFKCPSTQPICFPSLNSSVNCIQLLPTYESNIQKIPNITSNVIYFLENITCDSYIMGSLNDDTTIVNWVPDQYSESNPNIFGNKFHVSRSNKYKNPILMECIITFVAYTKIFHYHRYFNVTGPPTKVIFYNNKSVDFKDIYLGQSLECRGDSEPYNITVVMYILTQNFKINNSYKITKMPIKVPDNAELGFLSINCSINERFDGIRESVEMAKTFHIGLKSFVYFMWSKNYKNEYLSNEYVSCISMSFISNKLMVYQTIGRSFLNVSNPTRIPLDVETLGPFRLLCYMEFYKNNIIYTKIKDFNINRIPNYLCFQIFPPIRGSIIRCDHNGYPFDKYKYSLTLKDVHDFQSLAHNDDDYDNELRIPYHVSRSTVEIICKISDKIDRRISINKTVVFKLIKSGQHLVRITNDMLNCMNFGLIPEEKDIEFVRERSFLFKKATVLLVETPPNWVISNNIFILAIVLLAFCTLCMYKYIKYRMSTTNKRSVLIKKTTDRCRNIYRHRGLNDRLSDLSLEMRFCDQAKMVKLFEIHLPSLKDLRVGDNQVSVFTRPLEKTKDASFKLEYDDIGFV